MKIRFSRKGDYARQKACALLASTGSGCLCHGEWNASGPIRQIDDSRHRHGPLEAVVPGVEITLTAVGTNVAVRTVLSDANGNFEMPDLKPGLYRLKADLAGFKSFLADAVRLDGVQTRRIDVTLEVGTTAETVTVE